MIRILQVGFGPLGIQTARYISQKSTVKTVAVVDTNPVLFEISLSEISVELSHDITIKGSVAAALESLDEKPDIALVTTVSSLKDFIPQIEELAVFGLPVISTCEELSYPWNLQPDLSNRLDKLCKKHSIACLGTGVNPGFLMDYLPMVLSTVCRDVKSISITRVQDATSRRVPFQQKIGAGLTIEQFEEKKNRGVLRHVGLQESLYFLAAGLNVSMDKVTEELQPVVADKIINNNNTQIQIGDVRGVEQLAQGFINGEVFITMYFKAAVGEPRSYDQITIEGTPSFSNLIEGGINGDIATCSIAINCIKSVLKAVPGLHTMADIAVSGQLC